MPTELESRPSLDLQEKVLLGGDLARLTPSERLSYYSSVCNSLGLNPLTRPFEYITLNGKLTLYARKDCTEQLRRLHDISITIVGRELVEGVYVVTARAENGNRRMDESIGAVPIANLQGEVKANAMMKAETKAKRRVTLSICGLGMLDETEIESIPGATVTKDKDTRSLKEKVQAKLPSTQEVIEPRQEDGLQDADLPASAPGSQQMQDAPAPAAFIWRVGSKHKNESIATMPDDYLDWFTKEGKNAEHVQAALDELDRRRGQGRVA